MSAPPRASILVVDDEPDLRTLYELTLLREGYEVVSAPDLTQAREWLAQQRFDVLITDMRLPDGLGLELLRELADAQAQAKLWEDKCHDLIAPHYILDPCLRASKFREALQYHPVLPRPFWKKYGGPNDT